MNKEQSYDLSRDGHTAHYAMTLFTPEEFFNFWPKLEVMLDNLPHTWKNWTKDYIQNAVSVGTLQCWGVGPPPNAVLALLTSVNVYPATKVFHVCWAAGSFEVGMVPLMDATFVNYALLNGCSRIETQCRPGWRNALSAAGYSREAEIWSKDIHTLRMN
jgi:hypothetical protein